MSRENQKSTPQTLKKKILEMIRKSNLTYAEVESVISGVSVELSTILYLRMAERRKLPVTELFREAAS